jgi:hypothetical protein
LDLLVPAFGGFAKFTLPKNGLEDRLSEPGRFLSIFGISSEISTGQAFYLFKLKFFVVTSCVLLSQGKISKKLKKKLKVPKKTMTPQKIEKLRGAKEEQYLEEHIEEAVCYNCGRVLSCACFLLLLLSIILVSPFCYHTPGTWNMLDQQREQVFGTIIQHYFLFLNCVPLTYLACLP